MKHLTEEQLTLLYFGDSTNPDRSHLNTCALCGTEYARLARTLNALHAVPVPETAGGYEERLWASIRPIVENRLARRSRGFRLWMLTPALAAMLAVAFVAGMYTQHRVSTLTAQSIPAKARERVLLIALGDHMDRSQVVLAELVNAPEGRGADISIEREIAGGLVTENRLLRQTAARSGDRAGAAVLGDLERVLIEIAHSPADATPSQMDALRRAIEAEGLLFKVRVFGSNAREKGMKL